MNDESKKLRLFKQLKQSALGKEDLSLKGSIDEPIRSLVDMINDNDYYYTTSTCSGRLTLTEKPLGKSNIKRGNKFIYSSHEPANLEDLIEVLNKYSKDCSANSQDVDMCLWFKFEPFIMHIQCYDLNKARILLNLALAAGCRNSGITLGKPDKFMVAIRSTSSMEVPINCDTKFELPNSYIEFLHGESNRRMSDNVERLSKLQSAVEDSLPQHDSKTQS